MSTIPDIQRTAIQSRTSGVVNPRESGDGGFEVAADHMRKELEKRNRSEVAKARNKYMMVKAEEVRRADEEVDFTGIDDRYDKTVTEGLGLALQMVTDADAREALRDELELDHVRSKHDVNARYVRPKWQKKELADIAEESDILHRSAVNDEGDAGFILNAFNERLSAAVDEGIMDADKKQQVFDQFRDSVAVDKVRAMEPQDRLDALKSKWTEHLPAHVMKQLRDEAKDQLRLGKTQSIVDKLVADPDMGPAEARDAIYEKYKNDPELVRDATTSFNQAFNQRETSRLTSQREAYGGIFEMMDNGSESMPLDDIISMENQGIMESRWEQLSVGQKQDLRNWEANKSAGLDRKNSDRDVIMHLNVLDAMPDAGLKLYDYLVENQGKLTQQDFKVWAGKAAVGLVGEDIKPLISITEQIKLRTSKWTDLDRGQLMDGLNDRYFRLTDEEKRNLTSAEQHKLIEDAMAEHEIERVWWLPNATTKTYSADDHERVRAAISKPTVRMAIAFASQYDRGEYYRIMTEVFKDRYPKIMKDVLSKLSKDATHQDIYNAFEKLAKERGEDYGAH